MVCLRSWVAMASISPPGISSWGTACRDHACDAARPAKLPRGNDEMHGGPDIDQGETQHRVAQRADAEPGLENIAENSYDLDGHAESQHVRGNLQKRRTRTAHSRRQQTQNARIAGTNGRRMRKLLNRERADQYRGVRRQ